MVPSSVEYEVSHRAVKYPRLEFKTGKLMVILPHGQKAGPILEKHRRWIARKSAFIQECLKAAKGKRFVKRSDEEFRRLVHEAVEGTSRELRARVNNVFFRRMETKWASMSPNRNLTINTLMKYLPKRLIAYVVYHEAAHLKERCHNSDFWKIIAKKYRNYRQKEREMFVYWFLINEVIDNTP